MANYLPPSSVQTTIQQLSQQLRGLEQSCRGVPQEQSSIPTGVSALDSLLPAHGLRCGTLIEWLAPCQGSGATTLALTVASHILQKDDTCVVVDHPCEFYPPLAAALGINLSNTVVVRPQSQRETVWAFEQSLRCQGVALSVCWLGKLDSRICRRFQLAAEAGGGLGMLLRPAHVRREPSWAEVRFLVEPRPHVPNTERVSQSSLRTLECPRAENVASRRLHVELLYCRGGLSGEAVELEIENETGFIHLAPTMAVTTTLCRQTRA
jgi:protein ImuA